MEIGKSFTFVFEDKKWLEKVLVGGLVVLATVLFSWTIIIGILGSALLTGYMIQVVRNVRRGDPQPLPEWNAWGEKIVSGIKYLVILLIWSLPLFILWLPIGILSAVLGNSDASWIAGVVSVCFGCLAVVYGIFFALATVPITVRFAETDAISSGLAFGEIFAFTKKHIGDIIIILLVIWAVQIFASFIGLLLCGIGVLFTGFWALVVQGYLYGQVGRQPGAALTPVAAGSPYDLSPDNIMPGVGEIAAPVQDTAAAASTQVQELASGVTEATDDVQSGATQALDDVQDLASSVEEAAGDLGAPAPTDAPPPEIKPEP